VLLTALAWLGVLPACNGSDEMDRDAGTGPVGGQGPGTGVDLPDYAMVDTNPASPTFEQSRSLADTTGKVVLLYMIQLS
jgi:hypothetical protein